MRRALAALLALAAWAAVPQHASAEEPGWADAAAAVEAYFDGLPTLRTGFTQINADGSENRGLIWLWRPGLVRVEYSPPDDVLLVADGTWLIYYDADLDQVSHVPIGSGPFRFLLAEEISLGGDLEMVGLRRGGGLLRVVLQDPEAPDDGTLTLIFDEFPMQIRQWEVFDAQGYLTIVTLTDPVWGESFDRDWFYFPASARTRDFRIGDHD